MTNSGTIIFKQALGGAMAALVVGTCGAIAAQKPAMTSREAMEIGTEAYIFGYPLMLMDLTRQVKTNVREPEGMRAPMGRFAHAGTFPPASSQEVRVPNADMLASSLWLDVSEEPWVLSLPDMKDRYNLFTLIDGWSTTFASIGKRTTGTGPQKFAITGSDWKGKLPSGVEKYKCPTSLVWVLGRIYCTGTAGDYAAVHALQDQLSAVPLSSYGKAYTPPASNVNPGLDMLKPVNEQVNALGIANYFNWVATLMKENPPARADRSILKGMARLGIVPGQPFDIGKLDPAVIEVLQYVPNTAQAKIADRLKVDPKAKPEDWYFRDGWKWTLKAGTYDTDYIQRALVASIALGVPEPRDMLIAASRVDEAGQGYSGNFRYIMHFAPDQIPSADGFWSLTMYGSDYFFVDNPLSRYSLNARDQFRFNLDGSLDLYIQRHPPGPDREANWLPAPEGGFILVLRFYWPKGDMLKDSWKFPGGKRQG